MPPLIERVLRNLSWFERLITGPSIEFPVGEDMAGLEGGDPGHLFLGYYTEELITEGLEAHGILPRLRDKGFDKLVVKLDTQDPEHQALRLYQDQCDDQHLLGEAIYHEGQFRTRAPFAKLLHSYRFRMLFIQWMLLQNPFRDFTPDRPRLPGQHHPGLRVGHQAMSALNALVERLKYDGILVSPEFAHNALMYLPYFKYVDPKSQGHVQALQRDLADLTLEQAAWGIALGCVRNETDDKVFVWFHDEMCLPRRRRLVVYFKSDAYTKRVQRAMESAHFVFDRETYDKLYPDRETILARRTIPPGEDKEEDI